MPDLKTWFKKPRIFWLVGAVAVVVVLALAVVGLASTQAAPAQPFPYTHAPHIAAGIPCEFCHPGPYRGGSAGLPTKAKCMGCHNDIKPETAALKALDVYAQSHETFYWVPVAILPDFVYFSHQPHINAQLDCTNCHGKVSQMTVAQPQKYWNMGWCLSCHKTMAPANFVKLSDCATCHK